MSMPIQKPGKSKQDYGTPDDFFMAVEDRFGKMEWDLAASPENSKCGTFFFSEENSSLTYPLHKLGGNLWCNPPFAKIEPWVRNFANYGQIGARIFVLVPASVGSDWYRDFVEPYAYVLGLTPRLTFKGCKDPYPKDCILACYMHGLTGFKTWRWK